MEHLFALCFITLLSMINQTIPVISSGVPPVISSGVPPVISSGVPPAASVPDFFFSTLRESELQHFSDYGNSIELPLPGIFQYFGSSHETIYVNENGFLSFSELNNPNPSPNASQDIIAPLWTLINRTTGGNIFYDNVTEGPLLSQATEEINGIFPEAYFAATWLFIVTWESVSLADDNGEATFQVVLATDGDLSYVLMNYGDIPPIDKGWLAGYQTADQAHSFTIQVQNTSILSSDTNVGFPGRWDFRVNGGIIATCETLNCTKMEVCTRRTEILGCACSQDNPRSNPQTFDATETCASSSGKVSLSRCQLFEAGFPPEFLHLNDPTCRGEIQGDLVVFHFDNDANICGTTLQSNETHFIYENSIQTILGAGPKRLISRDSWLNITFSCIYPLIQSISMPMAIQAMGSVVSKELSTEGTYSIRMIPYPDASFSTPYSGNITLDVNQLVYVAVEVDGVDSRQIAVVLDNCWATPLEMGNGSVRWDLIINECPNSKDGTVQVLQNGNSTSSHFSFRMFTFTGISENVYLHCQVHLCLLKGGDCAQPCDSSPARKRRSLDFHDTVAITMGF